MRHGNTGIMYEMGATILCKTIKENDLGGGNHKC